MINQQLTGPIDFHIMKKKIKNTMDFNCLVTDIV